MLWKAGKVHGGGSSLASRCMVVVEKQIAVRVYIHIYIYIYIYIIYHPFSAWWPTSQDPVLLEEPIRIVHDNTCVFSMDGINPSGLGVRVIIGVRVHR
jgi:hypothetical protein